MGWISFFFDVGPLEVTNELTGIWSKVITIQAKRERVELK